MFSIAILTYTEIVKRYLLCHDWKLEITMALIILQENYQKKTQKRENIKTRFNIVKIMHVCSMYTCYYNKI